jgi:hypothetical protein
MKGRTSHQRAAGGRRKASAIARRAARVQGLQ